MDKVREMRHSPKTAWYNLKLLTKGHAGHRAQINPKKSRNKNGVITTTDGENESATRDHFKTLFNRDATSD